jgi:hypothetical protein
MREEWTSAITRYALEERLRGRFDLTVGHTEQDHIDASHIACAVITAKRADDEPS